jgi:predicted Zn-dependent protease
VADSNPRIGTSPIEAVTFLAGDELARDLVEDIVARTSRHLAVPCRLHASPWDGNAPRLDGREQFDADALLARLDAGTDPGVVQVGLTGHDIGLALFTYVFGRAKRNGHSAIVSLARLGPENYGLPPDPELAARRAVAEVLHELGHVAGLAHCDDLACIMYFATNVETIDLRGMGFCTACTAALPPRLLPSAIAPA